MVLLNEGEAKTVNAVTSTGYPPLGRTRLARDLFRGRFRPRQSVQLRKIAAEYQLDHESVLKTFAEFQALGMVTLSGNLSAIVRSRDPQETQEAYQIRAAIEEIAGRTAASVLKGYTVELRNQSSLMRKAVADGDLDAFAEHEVEFHRNIVKAAQNDVLLRVWDALAVDIRVRAVIGKLSKYLPKVVESHQQIVDALETGRSEEAGLLLRGHVEASLAYLAGNESDLRFQEEPPRNLEAIDEHQALPPSPLTHRGGLGPARLRRVTELVHAKIEEELRIDEMAESAGLSTAHFSQMFRRSTGESPHHFVLRQRVERAKEMLCTPGMRILDVAIACGFKTQQHFARVFRRMYGASPTEYRHEFLRYDATEAKPRWHESVPLRKGPADKTVALYDRAARYRPLLESLADRILGESGKAEVAVENCLHSAASESAPDCEGAFRGWLVRLAIDEALAILHGTPPDSRHLAFPSGRKRLNLSR